MKSMKTAVLLILQLLDIRMMRTILFYRGIAYICKNQETHSAGRQDYWRQYLQGTHFFDKLYVKMNEAEKREFLSQLVDNVQIYEERKESGPWLKTIEFKLLIIKKFTLSLENDTQNENILLLSK